MNFRAWPFYAGEESGANKSLSCSRAVSVKLPLFVDARVRSSSEQSESQRSSIKEHPDTLTSINNLAHYFHSLAGCSNSPPKTGTIPPAELQASLMRLAIDAIAQAEGSRTAAPAAHAPISPARDSSQEHTPPQQPQTVNAPAPENRSTVLNRCDELNLRSSAQTLASTTNLQHITGFYSLEEVPELAQALLGKLRGRSLITIAGVEKALVQ